MVKVGDRVRFLNSVGGGIVKKINKDISEVNSMLTIMEIEGTIEQVSGNYYVRAGKKIN